MPFMSVLKGQSKQTNNELAVGDLKVYKLQDAQMYLHLSLLAGIEHEEAMKLEGGSDSAWTPVNAYLVQTPKHLVLVDAGIGVSKDKNTGHLLAQMTEAGIDPANVDLILITHFHFDHIGGLLTPEGKRLFPNATVRVSQTENDFWMRDTAEMPSNLRERASAIKAILAPYINAKAYLPFASNEDFGDGIKAIAAFGHTPGHTVFTFSSKGQELWCIGDLIHFNDIQFTNPTVSVVFDSNNKMAIASRVDFFQRAALTHSIIAGAHLPNFLKLEKNGNGFVAIPVVKH